MTTTVVPPVTEETVAPSTTRGSRRRFLAPAAFVVACLVLWQTTGRSGDGRPERPAVATATAEVERRTLRQTITEEGVLGFADAAVLTARFGGVVTEMAPEGTVVGRGGVLYSIDRRPVVLLFGTLPAYRQLHEGVEGPDVRQLEENLVALGHAGRTGLTVDGKFTAATAAAVRRWQASLGQEGTGVVDLGSVVFLPGEARVGTHQTRMGATVQPETEVTEVTSTNKAVTVQLDARRAPDVEAGDAVQLELPSGTTTGTVASVGTVAQKADAESDPTVEVRITLDDQTAAGELDQAPVDVRIALDSVEALAVPVTALVALREGGYAVEVKAGARTRFVPVEIGAFADGYVEVRGGGLREGMKVVVPR